MFTCVSCVLHDCRKCSTHGSTIILLECNVSNVCNDNLIIYGILTFTIKITNNVEKQKLFNTMTVRYIVITLTVFTLVVVIILLFTK